MRTIYKYRLEMTTKEQVIYMPAEAEIVHVESQSNNPCMWVDVDVGPERRMSERRFIIFNTGDPIPNLCLKYVGTFMRDEGFYVGHIYEIMVF